MFTRTFKYRMFQTLFLLSWLFAGPATPGPFNVSVEHGPGAAGLIVSWEPVFQDYGAVVYLVNSSQGLQCNTTDLSCRLEPIVCAETYNLQMVAENNAGPSTPTDPETFVTCE